MSRLRIFDDRAPATPLLATTDRVEIGAELAKIGVQLEQWAPAHPVQPGDPPEAIMAAYKADIDRLVAANGFQPLPIDLRHTARVATLPFRHRDPFDRLLVAQALEEELAVVNADPAHQADPQVQCAVRQPPVRHDPGHAGDLTNEAVQEPGRRGRAVRHVETSRPPRTRRRRGRRRRRGGP